MGSLNIHVTIHSNFIQELRFNRLNGAGALAGAGAFGPAGAVFSPGLTLCSFQEVG